MLYQGIIRMPDRRRGKNKNVKRSAALSLSMLQCECCEASADEASQAIPLLNGTLFLGKYLCLRAAPNPKPLSCERLEGVTAGSVSD